MEARLEEVAKRMDRAEADQVLVRSMPFGLQIGAPATIKSYTDFFRKRCARKFDESCKIFLFLSWGNGI